MTRKARAFVRGFRYGRIMCDPYSRIVEEHFATEKDVEAALARAVVDITGDPGAASKVNLREMPGSGVHRDDFVAAWSWVRPLAATCEFVAARASWAATGKRLIEVMAGSGAFAECLRVTAGCDVVCCDSRRASPGSMPWTAKVEHRDARDMLGATGGAPDRALLMSWPSNVPVDGISPDPAADALARYAGPLLFFVGEPRGGCTAGARFWDAIDAGWSYAGKARVDQFPGVYDELYAFERCGEGSGVPRVRFAEEVTQEQIMASFANLAPRFGAGRHHFCGDDDTTTLEQAMSLLASLDDFKKNMSAFP